MVSQHAVGASVDGLEVKSHRDLIDTEGEERETEPQPYRHSTKKRIDNKDACKDDCGYKGENHQHYGAAYVPRHNRRLAYRVYRHNNHPDTDSVDKRRGEDRSGQRPAKGSRDWSLAGS